MKKVLCFGDSNVFGFNPKDNSRYSDNIRWSGLLKKYFSGSIEIIEAGCNNRVTFDNGSIDCSGIVSLQKLSIRDFFGVIFLIGINDLQKIYKLNKDDIFKNLCNLIELVKVQSPEIKILMLSPAKINKNILNSYFSTLFDESSIKKSENIIEIFKECKSKYNFDLIDLNEYVTTSNIDGLHFDIENHRKIFEVVKNHIKSWI